MSHDAYELEPEPVAQDRGLHVVQENAPCVTCGAPLIGKLADGVCECGTTVEYSRFGTEGGFSQVPLSTTPCTRCGYDLDGLKPEERCPECGLSIRRTLLGNALANSDPRYVQTLAQGALIAEWTVILNVLLVVGSVFLATFVRLPNVATIVSTLTVGLNVVSLGGWWMLSAPDPAMRGFDSGRSARKVLRITLVLLILIAVFNAVSIMPVGPVLWGVSLFGTLDSLVLTLALVIKLYTSMAYLSSLELRLRSSDMGAQIDGARTALTWSVGIFVSIFVIAFAAPCVSLVATLALAASLLIFLIRYIAMLEATRSALSLARMQAMMAD